MAVLALALVACGSDEGITAPTTSTGTPRTSAVTSPSPTTDATTSTTTSTSTSTVPVTSTTTVEDLKAQIAADFEKSFYRNYELVLAPSLDNLDAQVAEIAVPGSDAFTTLVAYIADLVRLGDRVIPNDPDILKVIVENVELVGEPPYTKANVTACKITNRKRVTPAENSPIGVEIPVGDSGKLFVQRATEPVQLAASGWLPTSGNLTGELFEGQETCPAP
jgi:hypothetical protein